MTKGVFRPLHSSVQDLLNESFDEANRLQMVEIAGVNNGVVYTLPIGPKGLETTTRAVTSRYDIQGTIAYVGEASVGSSEVDSVWMITKFDLANMATSSGKVALLSAWSTHSSGTYV